MNDYLNLELVDTCNALVFREKPETEYQQDININWLLYHSTKIIKNSDFDFYQMLIFLHLNNFIA